MELIYKASNISEAHIVAGLLKTYEIDAHVGGHYLQGGVGDLAVMDFATIHVADEDVKAARAIIDEYEQNNSRPKDFSQHKTDSVITPLIIIAASVLSILVLAILLNTR